MIRARRGEMALGKGRMGYERGEGTKNGENGADGWKGLGERRREYNVRHERSKMEEGLEDGWAKRWENMG